MKEVWRRVPGIKNMFASSFGRIRYRGEILNQRYAYRPCVPFKGKMLHVGTLVLKAFKGRRPSKRYWCLHWDDDPANNVPSNLRWGTPSDNAIDRLRNNVGPRPWVGSPIKRRQGIAYVHKL